MQGKLNPKQEIAVGGIFCRKKGEEHWCALKQSWCISGNLHQQIIITGAAEKVMNYIYGY